MFGLTGRCTVSARRISLLLFAPAILAAQTYFPPGALEDSQVQWYSKQLKALHEPSLWELSQKDPNAEVYRFLYLRSFDHPISVRLILRKTGSGWLYAHMTSGTGGHAPGGIRRVNHSWQTHSKTQSLLASFDAAGFWALPTIETTSRIGVDGAQWIFEGVRNGQYHVVDRWSPEQGDRLRETGVLALKLARFRLRVSEIY
jgi:hypothetical protein